MCRLVLPTDPPLAPHALHRIFLTLIDLMLIQVFVALEGDVVLVAVFAEEGLEVAGHEVLVEGVRAVDGGEGHTEGALRGVKGAHEVQLPVKLQIG